MQPSTQTFFSNSHESPPSNNTIINVQKKNTNKKLYDGIEVGHQFIQWFYSSWMNNIEVFVTDNTIKPYTKIKHEGVTYEGPDFLLFLKSVASNGLKFFECKCDIVDSGSRQIYILVFGKIANTHGTGKFSQTFTLVFGGQEKGTKSWSLVNSIFILE